MIFNFTNDYKFTTRLKLNDKNVDVIDQTKLLGSIITDDLKWDKNTSKIVKNANARMELLRKVASFGTDIDDLKTVYILYIRSILEQSATVWHSSLTQENVSDLERVQRSALKVILQDKYQGYERSLEQLGLESLSSRREQMCLASALKCTKNNKVKHMFPLSQKPCISCKY